MNPYPRDGGPGAAGSLEDDNVVIACRDCNRLKGRYMPEGETFQEKIEDAKRKVDECRSRRTAENRHDLLERLIRDRQEEEKG